MPVRSRQPAPPVDPTGSTLDPALLRLIEAMARADVERDMRAAGLLPQPGR